MLAKSQERPELVKGLNGTWRREQIRALVWDIFGKQNSPIELHEMFLLPQLRRVGRQPNELDSRNRLPTRASMALFAVLLVLVLLYRAFLR